MNRYTISNFLTKKQISDETVFDEKSGIPNRRKLPISPKLYENCITIFLWASWMTSISGLNNSNLLFSIFICLRLVKQLIRLILVIYFIRNYYKTSHKIKKIHLDIWRHFNCPSVFEFENKKFLSPYRRMSQYIII